MGDARAYLHVQSHFGNNLAYRALQCALKGKDNFKTYSFLERGSDERQFCAPGIDLPVAGYCRSKYAEYPEYRTSKDNFYLVTAKGLQESFDVMRSIVDAFELGLNPQSQVLGEPQLGKSGLYPTLSKKGGYEHIKLRINCLAYADGKQICLKLEI